MSTQREDILGCACELFTEEGLEGFSMRRLARSVGVTAPALYRHFDGKEDVLTEVVGEAFELLSQYLYRSMGAPTPMDRILAATDAYLDFALDHPRYYETIHAPLEAIGIEELPERIYTQACSVGQFWLDRHRELLAEGLIRESDPHVVSLTMWAHGHGLISLYRRGMMAEMDEETFRRVYRESSLRVLRGIGTNAGVSAAEAAGWPGAPAVGQQSPEPGEESVRVRDAAASPAAAMAAGLEGDGNASAQNGKEGEADHEE